MSAGAVFAEHLPEPRTLWTRWTPRGWRGGEGLWFELTSGGLGGAAPGRAAERHDAGRGEALDALDALDDVVYLPPPGPGELEWRDELAARAAERGLHPLIHTARRDPLDRVPGPSRLLIDDLQVLLGEDGERPPLRLTQLALEVEVVWLLPAIAGLTVGDGRETRLGQRLAELGAAAVHVYEPRLEGAELRRIAETVGPRAELSMFHAEPVDGTGLMRAMQRAGLRVLHPRPPVGRTPRQRELRGLAGALGQAADLWLRDGRPAGGAQALFRAAREIDRTALDLRALAREGNLKVLDWLEEPAAVPVERWLAGEDGSVALLDELVERVLGARRAQSTTQSTTPM